MRNSKEFRMLPLHKALKIKRIVNNHTQDTLSTLLNIPQPTISHVESGNMAIPNEYIPAVCEYLYGIEKRSLEKKESKVEEYSIGFSPLDGKQDLPHVLELSTENIEMVVGCLKLKVLHTTDDYLLYEPFMVTIVRHNCPSPKCVAMGRLQDFYRVLFTPEGIELTEKKNG